MTVSTLERIAPAGGSTTNVPAGNISATDVQGAINELDNEKVAKAGDVMTGALRTTKQISIGSATPSNTMLNLQDAHVSGATAVYGIQAGMVAPATATAATYAILTRAATAAASFTCAEGNGLYVGNATQGTGSTITDLYGVNVIGQTNATNGYGVAIGASKTATLWLSHKSDATTPAGGITFGSSKDTNLYRSAADTLKTDDSLISNTHYVVTAASSTTAYVAQATGDATGRFAMTASGNMSWGDGTNARDTNLYRSAADTLKTDDVLVVAGGAITVGASAAVTGSIRLPTTGSIMVRNAANDGDHGLIGHGSGYSAVFAGAGEAFYVNIGGANPLEVSATNGLKTTWAITTGTNPAQSGQVRMPNNAWLAGRNSPNDADVLIIRNSGYLIDIGGSNVTAVNITPAALAIGSGAATTGVLRIPNNVWAYARNAAADADIPLFILTNTNKTALNSGVEVQLSIGTTPKFSVAASLNTSVNDFAIGTNPASAGAMRLKNGSGSELYWRNAANDANVFGLYVDSSNRLCVGNTTTTGGVLLGSTDSTKVAAYGKTPDAQPTTAITGAAFVAGGTGTAVTDVSTFGGYTLGQIAAALIREGWLA